MKAFDDRTVRTPERERDDVDALLADEPELGLPVVVIVAGLAELDAQPLRFGADFLEVGAERLGIRLRCRGDKDVDSERLGRLRAQLRDFLAHGLRVLVAGCDEAKPSRLADRDCQLRCRRSPSERRLDYRLSQRREVEHVSSLLGEVLGHERRDGGCGQDGLVVVDRMTRVI